MIDTFNIRNKSDHPIFRYYVYRIPDTGAHHTLHNIPADQEFVTITFVNGKMYGIFRAEA